MARTPSAVKRDAGEDVGADSADAKSRRHRAIEFFGLTPEIVAVSTSMFLLGCGENLWRRFLPKYLQSLGAPITAIGAFGTAEDFGLDLPDAVSRSGNLRLRHQRLARWPYHQASFEPGRAPAHSRAITRAQICQRACPRGLV